MGGGVATVTGKPGARGRVAAVARAAVEAPDLRSYGGDLLAFLGDAEPSNDPEAVYWCDGLIVRGEPMLVLGDPKIGKTLAVEDLAVCMAAGLPDFCGRRIYGRPRVLLMPREDATSETKRRLWQIMRARGIDRHDLVGWLEVDGVSPLYFDRPDSVAGFRAAGARFDVILIDSLSTIHSIGDENSNGAMSPAMAAWRDLTLGDDKTIAIVHHLRKPGEGTAHPARGGKLARSRGASIIAATARHAVTLTDGPADDQILITVEGNHARLPSPFVIARRVGADATGEWVRHELIGDPEVARSEASAAALARRIERALADASEPMTRNAIVAALEASKPRVLAAIRRGVAARSIVEVASDDGREAPVMLASTARALGYQPPSLEAPDARWSRP